jgi:NAD(P)H dehydrogenase (quinone)
VKLVFLYFILKSLINIQMKTLVIVAHPNPASFNKNGILETVVSELKKNNHEVMVRDLYELNFNPVLSGADFNPNSVPADVQTERDHVSWANNIVMVYPVWWIGRPAIMQGYIDRVFGFNFAFTVDENGARGLLKIEKGLVINTSGTPEGVYDGWAGSKALISRPISEGVLGYVGVKDVRQKTFFGIATSTDEQRAAMLEEVKAEVAAL